MDFKEKSNGGCFPFFYLGADNKPRRFELGLYPVFKWILEDSPACAAHRDRIKIRRTDSTERRQENPAWTTKIGVDNS